MNKQKAKEFAERWKDRGDEKQHAQQFLTDFAQNVLEIDPLLFDFEKRSAKQKRGNDFIDAYVNLGEGKRTIIEMKSKGIPLDKQAKQSDGRMATPFEQALNYNTQLARSEMADWIITSNFQELWIYDLENVGKARFEPVLRIKLDEMGRYPDAFRMFDPERFESHSEGFHKEVAVSVEATRYISEIYQELEKAYKRAEPDVDRSEDLNKLAVRLVFLLYAEDAGLLIHNDTQTDFWDYLKDREPRRIRQALIRLFDVLNTPVSERDPYLSEDDPYLAAMPYVNGGLFKDRIVIPGFTEEIKETIKKASLDFNWVSISPTIFGAMFEGTLNPETRRSGGMHYTSVENIHKVIDPLFLDDLTLELERIKNLKVPGTRLNRVNEFRQKLGKLKFLDPALGSGNFITESYLSLRRLENEALKLIARDQMALDVGQIEVTIDQFYGIEINDFAVAVAQTAIVLAEHQMMRETEKIIDQELEFLPLRSHDGFHEGNALRMDWNEVIPAEELDYIIGNPPFYGSAWQTEEQKKDLDLVFGDLKNHKKLDYVSAWFKKTADFMKDTSLKAALVSTNSISQGISVPTLWKHLNEKGISIDFAWPTFVWNNNTKDQAKVHCVIIGFSKTPIKEKTIFFQNGESRPAKNINAYLADSPDVFIESSREQIFGFPAMHRGSDPVDGGNLLMNESEYQEYAKQEPAGLKYVHPYMMGREFINKIPRYCFWLVGVDPSEIRKLPLLYKRVQKVQAFRSTRGGKNPLLFDRQAQPERTFIAVPKVSSQRREYIPIGYLDPNIIAGDKLFVIEDGDLVTFGILNSKIHNDWMRTVAGRLKSDYSYSNTLVYNTFPFPEPTAEQRAKIERTAQAILDARDLYPNSSLADLYDPLTMPSELRKAHQANDRAVMKAYGFKPGMDESEILARLFEMYQQKIDTL